MSKAEYLSYRTTRRFSALVLDYLDQKESLKPFYQFAPNLDGLNAAIETRNEFPVDRKTLVDVLQRQYRHFPEETLVTENIQSLAQANTFTICTAHQPNLATGYLYFVFKILHVVSMADALKKLYPTRHFVPVYYIGSEDADLDELGQFRFGGEKFVWDADGQTGAVGRMKTKSLTPLFKNLFSKFGPTGENMDNLQALLHEAYGEHDTIAQATQYLVHRLFGKYGLVTLDPDDADLKRGFIPIMKEDLLQHSSLALAEKSIAELAEQHYKSQAFPRSVNLFYLKENLRERIEKAGENWQVVGTELRWNEEELIAELESHPERFSPNVILRPVFQEFILPNIVFIGGGSEVAYWMQLKRVFDQHHVFFPVIYLRQSLTLLSKKDAVLLAQTGLDLEDVFAPAFEAQKAFVALHATEDFQLSEERLQLKELMRRFGEKAEAVDHSLARSAAGAIAKMNKQVDALEKRMLRAEKKKQHIGLERLSRLQASLFPGGGLQERVENFMPYFLAFGPAFFDDILKEIRPFDNQFLVHAE